MKKIIYTDLDGTLLDHDSYSFDDAKDTLKKLKEKETPVVICSSKTRAEIDFFRKKIDNNHPFISENGGGIFIPKKYFDFEFDFDRKDDDYKIIALGPKYDKLVETLKKIKENYEIKTFFDMTPKEIADDSNLDIKYAKLAKKREFDIPFKVKNFKNEDEVKRSIRENNLRFTKGGRYYHLIGKNNKGRAVDILTDLYKKRYGEVFTIGIGDSDNDFSMLDRVDRGYLVIKKDDEEYASKEYNPAGEIGPKGWKRVVEKELEL